MRPTTRRRSGSSTTPASSSSATGASCWPRRRSRSRSTARSSTRPPTATARSTPWTPPCARRCGAFYPGLDEVHLVDYKVRILDGGAATAARTRVIIDSMDGARTWSTMGSDTNIIAASASALADLLEYAIWKSGSELRRRDERQFTTTGATPRPRPRPAARPRPHGGDPMTDIADALELSRWTASSGQQRPQPRRGRHRLGRPRMARIGRGQRRDRRAVPGRRRGAGRACSTGHPRLLAYDIHALGRGHRHDRRGHRADRAAGHRRASAGAASTAARRAGRTSSPPRSRPTSRRSTRCSPRRTGPARPRRRATARASPSSAGTAREQRADLDEGEAPHDTTAWFER